MNIAIILEATLGGTRKHVLDLLVYMNNKSENKYFFIYSKNRADALFFETITRENFKNIEMLDLPLSINIFSLSFYKSFFVLRKYFKQKNIQIIHLHGAVAGAIGRIASIQINTITRVIYSPHGGVLHKINGSVLGKLYQLIEKLLAFKKCFFIAVSSEEKIEIMSKLNVKDDKINIIPNGFDFAEIKASLSLDQIKQERQKLGVDENDFVLLYPALFLKAKGHLNFLKAIIDNEITLDQKIKIVFVGNGPLEESIKEIAQSSRYKLNFLFKGFVKDIELYYQLCDAVVLMSSNEAFGYVLLEAMAYKKAIFATNIGGIKDIVNNNVNGWLYDLPRINTVVKDLNSFTVKKELLSEIGNNGYKLLKQNFNFDRTMLLTEELYKIN